jgi:hypothetical protein
LNQTIPQKGRGNKTGSGRSAKRHFLSLGGINPIPAYLFSNRKIRDKISAH